MTRASYSLWPEDRFGGARRSPAKLIIFAFIAGGAVAILAPLAVSYYAGLVEPEVAGSGGVALVEQPPMPSPQITARFQPLMQRERLSAGRTALQPPIQATVSPQPGVGEDNTTADVPLPTPRPPNIDETSKAVTAYTESSDIAKTAGDAANDRTASKPPVHEAPTVKIKQADSSVTKVAIHRPMSHDAARTASHRDDITIVHTPDGRRVRVYGLGSDQLIGEF
jgi:hypothetical protein